MFKLLGIILGYLLFGWIGAFLGFLLGIVIDRVRAFGQGAFNPLRAALRQAVFLETVFIAMGKLAKADGRVSEAEIAHTEVLMNKLGMSEGHRQQAIALFKQGASGESDIYEVCRRFMATCGHTHHLKEMLLVYLIVMAMADGEYHPEEEKLLMEIAGHLGYGPQAFKRLLDMVLNQAHFASGQGSGEAALAEAYKALGVSAESSDAEVKRAYRKLMSKHHPDKLMGQGLPEDMIKVATEQAKEIQLAYDLVSKQRGM
ncbi:MAG: co-chaperone DjlA [Pseudomonadota bacterium]